MLGEHSSLLAMLLIMTGTLVLIFSLIARRQMRHRLNWPRTQGEIERLHVQQRFSVSCRSTPAVCDATVYFRYAVEDMQFGAAMPLPMAWAEDPKRTQTAFERYPVRAPVQVLYNPAMPQQAILGSVPLPRPALSTASGIYFLIAGLCLLM